MRPLFCASVLRWQSPTRSVTFVHTVERVKRLK